MVEVNHLENFAWMFDQVEGIPVGGSCYCELVEDGVGNPLYMKLMKDGYECWRLDVQQVTFRFVAMGLSAVDKVITPEQKELAEESYIEVE